MDSDASARRQHHRRRLPAPCCGLPPSSHVQGGVHSTDDRLDSACTSTYAKCIKTPPTSLTSPCTICFEDTIPTTREAAASSTIKCGLKVCSALCPGTASRRSLLDRILSVTLAHSRCAQCDHDHVTCDECFERYSGECISRLETTNLLASEGEKAEAALDDVRMQELAGQLHCPSCKSGPFSDRQVALHMSNEGFSRYCGARTLLPAARKVKKALEKGAELKALFPHARQCGSCGFGPVEHMACSDLAAHHGELRAGAGARIDNACPACGWFAENIEQWPAWDGLTQVADGNEDPLERAAAMPAVEDEASARETRRRRGEELERWREERRRAVERREEERRQGLLFFDARGGRQDEGGHAHDLDARFDRYRPLVDRFRWLRGMLAETEEDEEERRRRQVRQQEALEEAAADLQRQEHERRNLGRNIHGGRMLRMDVGPRLNAQQVALSEAMFGTGPEQQPGRRQRRRERLQRG